MGKVAIAIFKFKRQNNRTAEQPFDLIVAGADKRLTVGEFCKWFSRV
jgi:hypothetical protein